MYFTFLSKNKLLVAITFALILIVSFILFVPPQIGIADSGDFGRIIARFNLYYVAGYYKFYHFYDTFTFGRPQNAYIYNGYFATTSLFIYPALIFNNLFILFSKQGNLFYIYSLSSMYLVVYAMAFYILIHAIFDKLDNRHLQITIGFIAVLALSDSLFIEYFNSFFQEAGFIVSFLLFIACFLRYKIFILDIICLTLLIFSKEQNILFLLLLIPLFYKHKFSYKKLLVLAASLTIPLYIFSNINIYTQKINAFESMFYGALYHETSESGAKILTSINLNPKYVIFINRDYWSIAAKLRNNKNSEEFKLWWQALSDANHVNVLKVYYLNPLQFWANCVEYLNILQKDGPFAPNLGNYSKAYKNKYRVLAFTTFSYFLKNIGYMTMFNVIFFIGLVIYFIKYKFLLKPADDLFIKTNILTLFILNIIVIITIPVNIVGAGFTEPVKHFLNAYYTEAIITVLNIFCIFILAT